MINRQFLIAICVLAALSHVLSVKKNELKSIFEAIGFDPACVAAALASCEPRSDAELLRDVHATVLHLRQELDQIKAAMKETSTSCGPSADADILKEDLSKVKEETPYKPKNCAEIRNSGDSVSGVRTIYPYPSEDKSVAAFCDQTTDEGGWTVIQNRDALPVRENFYRTWKDYVQGFGNLTGEFWLGLDNIRALVNSTSVELRVDLEDYKGVKRWAKYGTFSIGDASTKYTLNIGKYTGDAGDGFHGRHQGYKFSTRDQDNDAYGGNCADLYKGGWWYDACHISNLNGLPHEGDHSSYADGINWSPFRGYNHSMRKASMKIRPVSKK